jgi:hypothetical protein
MLLPYLRYRLVMSVANQIRQKMAEEALAYQPVVVEASAHRHQIRLRPG